VNGALLRSFDGLASRIDATGARRVGFTSTLLGEGVSTIAVGTALALAAMRAERVLLIDANWLQPSLSADAGLERAPGLADHLAGHVRLVDVVRQSARDRLAFVPIGNRTVARPSLRSLAVLLASQVDDYQTVVIDLPPVLAGETYVVPWTSLLDRVFVVLREAATPLSHVRMALEKIDLGTPQIVLNRTAHAGAELPTRLLAPLAKQA
jgi:Mrp family chromosome partitioning ATPase